MKGFKVDARILVELVPKPPNPKPPIHHVGNPPTSFINPWSSAPHKHTRLDILKLRFGNERNFVPVPADRKGLVTIQSPNWGSNQNGLKATWIGHASFLIETTSVVGASRGVRLFLDPVFAERMSPLQWIGPKRFSPPPCQLQEVPEIDLILISHNHYDHLDISTIQQQLDRAPDSHIFCPLRLKQWFLSCGIPESNVTELDWWESVKVQVKDVGSVLLHCTPAQHTSARTPFDTDTTLWCSWVIEESNLTESSSKKLFFSGDTGYRAIMETDSAEEIDTLPGCPAFADIGQQLGPFDLALLPIGCYTPRKFMSSVHCCPTDSVRIHKDIRSKKSLGMHYGTVRGGLSSQYEDVLDPPRDWKLACDKAGLRWGEEILLCDIGETIFA